MKSDLIIKELCKGIDNIVGLEDLKKKLDEGRVLNIKFGLDPTAPDIHLGHTVILRKLRFLQDLGHNINIIIGDFTARIGDPTGRSKVRKSLSEEEVIANSKTYFEQVFKILDKEKTKILYNSHWLKEVDLEKIIELSSILTVSRMLERDDFKKRFRNQIPIGIHEFLYPLLQAYDSIVTKSDLEFGGTEQTFNILLGRSMQKHFNMSEQVAIFLPLLKGLDGVEKMSKSLNNYIGITEDKDTMFKKSMEIPDSLIIEYFNLVTNASHSAIKEYSERLHNGENPKNIKLILAKEIVTLYHGEKDAERAFNNFIDVYSNGNIPQNIPNLNIKQSKDSKDTSDKEKKIRVSDIIDSIVKEGYVSSKNDFKRLLLGSGVRVNGKIINSIEDSVFNGDVIKIGKKKFLKIILQ